MGFDKPVLFGAMMEKLRDIQDPISVSSLLAATTPPVIGVCPVLTWSVPRITCQMPNQGVFAKTCLEHRTPSGRAKSPSMVH